MDKCPFCGSPASKINQWLNIYDQLYSCGSARFVKGEFVRSTECYEREIAALQEKVECLKDLHLEISALKERLQSLAAHAVLDEQEIAALKERLEAWKVYALAQKTAWDYTPTRQAFETIQQAEDRLRDLNEL